MLCETFISVLKSERSAFNARFAHAKRQHALLDAEDFKGVLVEGVDPVVRAVEQCHPELAATVAIEAYEIALELVGQGIAGRRAKHPAVMQGWMQVLPAVPRLVAEAPRRLMTAVSNGLYHLAGVEGARPEQWVCLMIEIGPRTRSVDEFLKLGQVAAWRSGMAHFREGALAAADALPEAVALAAIGVAAGVWSELRGRIARDQWFNPAEPINRLRVVGRVGRFRGFGGLFEQPPQVGGGDRGIYVFSGDDCWLMITDIVGVTFHRTSRSEAGEPGSPNRLPPEFRIADGKLSWNDEWLELPIRGEVTSAVMYKNTIAVTSALTHAVGLVALPIPS